MNRKNVKDFIEKEFLGKSSINAIDDDSNLIESGVIDSLGIQSLIAFLEGAYGIEISDMDLVPENFETISAIDNYITRNMKQVT